MAVGVGGGAWLIAERFTRRQIFAFTAASAVTGMPLPSSLADNSQLLHSQIVAASRNAAGTIATASHSN